MSEQLKRVETLSELRHDTEHSLEASYELSDAEKAEAATQQAQVAEAARQQVEKAEAQQPALNPVEQLAAEQVADEAAAGPQTFREAPAVVVARELQQIRRHLSRGDRALSKAIHQPAIRAASDAAAKTVSRPSGLLGGGILAFLGSTGYLLFTKHIGLPYNYLLFLGFFVGGFVIGLLLEFVIWASRGRKAVSSSS